jgi:hypothetical protein
MTVERCGPVDRQPHKYGVWDRRSTMISALHPEIQSRIGDQRWATRLHATLTPIQQQADIDITFDAERYVGTLAYTKEVILERSIRAGLLLIAFAALIWAAAAMLLAVPFYKGMQTSTGSTFALGTVVAAVLVGIAQSWLLPVGELAHASEYRRRLPNEHSHKAAALALSVPGATASQQEQIERVRVQASRAWAEQEHGYEHLTPEHNDSPLNYVIRANSKTGNIEYAFYDLNGQETVINLGDGN